MSPTTKMTIVTMNVEVATRMATTWRESSSSRGGKESTHYFAEFGLGLEGR